jgi:hypothetical protein
VRASVPLPSLAPMTGHPPDLGVRRGTEDDAERLERIVAGAHGSEAWLRVGMPSADILSRTDHRVYFATSGGRCVGCLIASGMEYTVLHSLSVLLPHRGMKHASNMINAALGDAGTQWGLKGMVATVAESDRSGRDRFMRCGFRQIPNYVRGGLIALQIALPLDGSAQTSPIRSNEDDMPNPHAASG